jgi:hypothetical protein
MSIGFASRTSRFLLVLTGALALLSFHTAVAQDGDDEDQPLPPPSPAEIAKIEARSLDLLRCITPRPLPVNLLGVLKSRALSPENNPRPMEILETSAGTIRWGTLFSPDEIVALVNLAPATPAYVYEYPPQYLTYFAWQKGRWVCRQFLGNAWNLSLRYRTDSPSAFVLGSYKYARYEGDYVSWAYNSKSRLLEQTNFEDWGPFYLVGNYLIGTRGFERLAHDDTYWIHSYAKGKKGPLLAVVHDNDRGYFDVTIRSPKSGNFETWNFTPDQDGPYLIHVAIEGTTMEDNNPQGGPAIDERSLPERTGELMIGSLFDGESDSPIYSSPCLRLLTGIDFSQLGDPTQDSPRDAQPFWPQKLPPPPPGVCPSDDTPIQATGDPEIVERFQWPRTGSPHRVDFLFDPLHTIPGPLRFYPQAYDSDSFRQTAPPWPKTPAALEARALRVVGDIDPSRLPAGPLACIDIQGARGICGPIFGDSQLGAIVAIYPDSSREDAELCLLLWNGAWKFRQDVGTISSTLDDDGTPSWMIKTDSSHRHYVIDDRDLYPKCSHRSWLCDSRNHRLVSTGWPMDAIPSVSGDTITFTREENPGHSPDINDIYQFADGRVGSRIATVTQSRPGPPSSGGPFATIWDNGQPVTWQIWTKSQAWYQNDLFALSCTPGDRPIAHPHEDVLVKFDWQGVEGYDAESYLLSRLTGLSADALRGIWDTDPAPGSEWSELSLNEDLLAGVSTQVEKNKIVPPRSATVTGQPDAVSLLQWPQPKADSH